MNQDGDGKTKDLMGRTISWHVRLKLCIDFFHLSSAQQQSEITKIHELRERKSRHKFFLSFHLELNTDHVGYAKFEL